MWESGGADRAAKEEAEADIPRRDLQWEAHQEGPFSWQEVPGLC